jgi:1-acyl-sn-glycerol-3-phosphate acyltransferase
VRRHGRTSLAYRIVLAFVQPIVRWWGRLTVVGAEFLPKSGPTLLFANHDSMWDPMVIGVATSARRQIRALAISTLWRRQPMGWMLDRMGQIPIDRDRGDSSGLERAIDELKNGACIGVFPEGTVSRGRDVRARSGAGRLALAVPEAAVICAAVVGSTDVAHFPKRPKIQVTFFRPKQGGPLPGESAAQLSTRVMAEIRALAPIPRQQP